MSDAATLINQHRSAIDTAIASQVEMMKHNPGMKFNAAQVLADAGVDPNSFPPDALNELTKYAESGNFHAEQEALDFQQREAAKLDHLTQEHVHGTGMLDNLKELFSHIGDKVSQVSARLTNAFSTLQTPISVDTEFNRNAPENGAFPPSPLSTPTVPQPARETSASAGSISKG